MQPTDWNKLADIFDDKATGTLHPSEAGNMLVAWPAIFNIIDQYSSQKVLARFLDFGCGTGGFALELSKRSYEVMAIDPAVEMITLAKKHNNGRVRFLVGGIGIIDPTMKFDCIVSIMVLQFVESLSDTLEKIAKHLEKDGLLVFAVHNPAYVEACLVKGMKYKRDQSGRVWRRYKDRGAVEINVQDEAFYIQALSSLGMRKIATSTPQFTEEYISKYGVSHEEALDIPKFLIMAFVKE